MPTELTLAEPLGTRRIAEVGPGASPDEKRPRRNREEIPEQIGNGADDTGMTLL